MAKRRKKGPSIVKQFSDLLLYEITGGNMGTAPKTEIKSEVATFGEKRAFLDTLIKIAVLEKKDDDDDQEGGFETILKQSRKNGRAKSGSGRNPWGAKDSEPASDDGEDSDDSAGDGDS